MTTMEEGHLGFGESAEADRATRAWWQFEALYEKWKKLMTEADVKVHKPEDWHRVARHANVGQNRISIRVDANALAIIGLVMSAAAMALVIAQSYSTPQIVDAKITAAAAKADAEANEAKVNSRIAIKEVETLCASLKAANVKNVDCH